VTHDEDVFFAVYFFDKCFFEYASLLNWIYRSTFFILAFTMVNCSHLFLYVIQQMIFQMYLLVTHLANLTNVVQYNSEDDSSLLKNEHYQMEVENRIKFCIKKHVDIISASSAGVKKLRKWIPLFALNGILLFICCIFYCFLNEDNPKRRYYRVGAICIVGLTTFCSLIFIGQRVENESDLLLRINTEIRWTSLNRKNLNLLTIMSIVMKTPFTLKFSDNLIINYAVGLKIVKVVYTVL
ncbi:unnamed protein product, partial [Tenebrio molitor]